MSQFPERTLAFRQVPASLQEVPPLCVCTLLGESQIIPFLPQSNHYLWCFVSRHVDIYIQNCAKLGIKPHPRALSRVAIEGSNDRCVFSMYLLHCQVSHLIPRSLHQSSLDNAITREPKQPVFTTAGLLDHLVELIVCEDEVCFLISGYVLLLTYLKGLPFSRPRPLSSSPQILSPLPYRKGYPSPKNSSG